MNPLIKRLRNAARLNGLANCRLRHVDTALPNRINDSYSSYVHELVRLEDKCFPDPVS